MSTICATVCIGRLSPTPRPRRRLRHEHGQGQGGEDRDETVLHDSPAIVPPLGQRLPCPAMTSARMPRPDYAPRPPTWRRRRVRRYVLVGLPLLLVASASRRPHSGLGSCDRRRPVPYLRRHHVIATEPP